MQIQILTLLAATAGAGFLLTAQAQDEPGYALPVGYDEQPANCFITIDETRDGQLVTAWSDAMPGGSYQLVVTRGTGNGGFDLVQEGDLPWDGPGAQRLSDMQLDAHGRFTAQLTTYGVNGEALCHWG